MSGGIRTIVVVMATLAAAAPAAADTLPSPQLPLPTSQGVPQAAPSAAAPAAAAGDATAEAPLAQQVLAAINDLRRSHGLVPLKSSSRLARAAAVHSFAMAKSGFFSHSSSDGSPFWKRVKSYYGAKGWAYWATGENLLWASPELDAGQAITMWMNSPPHRENLLLPRWREIGLSAVHAVGAGGSYGGLDVTIVTADFGVRR